MLLSNAQPYERLAIEANAGTSSVPSLEGHQHPMFDNGFLVALESPWENFSRAPATVYKVGDWVLLEGIIFSNGNLTARDVDVIFTVPLEYRPTVNHYFLASAFEDHPAGSAFVDIYVATNGQVTRLDPAALPGSTIVVDELGLHGLNWRIT